MRYAVLYAASREAKEGKSWAIVEADEPAEAASMAGGRAIATDDTALVIALGQDPTKVHAKVGWVE